VTKTLVAGALSLGLLASAREPARVERVAAGGNQSILQTSDGTLWVWGDGDPALTPLPTRFLSFAAGRTQMSLLSSDGTVWRMDGAARESEGDPAAMVVPFTGVAGVAALAAAGDHTLAWKIDGSVWRFTQDEAPTRIAGLPPFLTVAAGIKRDLALAFDGTVWTFSSQDAPSQVRCCCHRLG